MVSLRFLFGLTSGVALPSAFTVIAEWLPCDQRGSGVGVVMGMFNIGSALGFFFGSLIPITGWPSLFHVAGIAGVSFSIVGLVSFNPHQSPKVALPGSNSMDSLTVPIIAKAKSQKSLRSFLSWRVAGQLACMMYVHTVINVAFFVFQNWLPKYMVMDLGMDISKSACMTAFPWAVLAGCSMIAGHTSDYMLGCGWNALRVRQVMVGLSTLIPALCLMFLGVIKDPIYACVLLVMALAAHGFNTAGYHSHIQDVAPDKAGLIIGLTNTVGIVGGIGAQLIIALLVEKTGNFTMVFNLTALLYISAFAIFGIFMQGGPLLGPASQRS
jgi:MFS family permease